MSWEEMSCETRPCACGKGTVTYRSEMDDWNRIRSSTSINCPICRAEADAKEKASMVRERKREELLAKAHRLAERRYLEQWLAMFRGKTKKDAWLVYTGGRGYPALGTFYNHVRDDGVETYLRQHFQYDLETAMKKLCVKDSEIETLLRSADELRRGHY